MEREVNIQIRSTILNESETKLIMESCLQEKGNIFNDHINIITHISEIEEEKAQENDIQHNEIIIDFNGDSDSSKIININLETNSILLENKQIQTKRVLK